MSFNTIIQSTDVVTAHRIVSVPSADRFGGAAVLVDGTIDIIDGQETIVPRFRWAVCLYRDPDDPDGWVTADVMALPGVSSEGETEVQARANIKAAILAVREDIDDLFSAEAAREYVVPADGHVAYISASEDDQSAT